DGDLHEAVEPRGRLYEGRRGPDAGGSARGMKRIIADVRAFGVQFMRSRIGAFFAIAFPIILILLFGVIFSGGGSQKVPIYVQDFFDIPLSADFMVARNVMSVLDVCAILKTISILDYIRQNLLTWSCSSPSTFRRGFWRTRP